MRVVIWTIVLAAVVSVDAKPSKRSQVPDCSLQPDGTFIADETSRTDYFICQGGVTSSLSCGPRNHFDKTSLECVTDMDNGCAESGTGGGCGAPTDLPTQGSCTCAGGYQEGEFIPSLDKCYAYLVCTEGQLVEQSCGNGNYFDKTTKICTPDENNVCWAEATPSAPCGCPGGYGEGDLVADANNCQSYFICKQGQLVAESCGIGNYFDTTSKACAPDKNQICWPAITQAPTPAPCSCPGGLQNGDFIEYPNVCDKYYMCYNGELIEQSCGDFNYFDVELKSCVRDFEGKCWPLPTQDTTVSTSPSTPSTNTPLSTSTKTSSTTTTTNAPYKCPGGYEQGEFVENPNSCDKYYVCYNGKLIEQSCGNGNYFNNETKSCTRDINGECWPLSTTSTAISTSTSTTSKKTSTSSTPSTGSSTTTTVSSTPLSTSTSSTKTTSTTTTTQPPSSCPGGYENGEFIPYPNSCDKYYICYNGELLEKSCGYGNYFDKDSKSCVCDLKGECWPLSTTSTAISTSTSTTSTKTSTSSTPSTASSTTTTISSTPLSTRTTSTTTSSTTTQPPCSCPGGYENGEFIPYPNSCDKYYICYNGELLEKSCGYGNYFDKDSKSCVCDLKGECWPLSTTSTAISTSTSTTSTKTSTSSTPSTGSSTTTTVSSTPLSTKTTSTTTSSTTTTTQPPCSCPGGYENGEFIPYPNSCDKYYICYNGELLEKSCGYGNYFDKDSKSCVCDLKGECWPLSTTSTAISTSTSTTSTKTSTSSTPSTASSTTTTISSTPLSTRTTSTTTSTTTTTTQPPCSCPGGYENGEFIPYPNSCDKYYICYNGELLEKSCGYGNYFDKDSKSCVCDLKGECWPLSTTSTAISTSTSTTSTKTSTSSTPSTASSTTTTISSTPLSTKTTSTTTSSTTTQPPCSCPGGYENGEFIPYPNSCDKYYICYNGELLEESCGYGNYFDKDSKSCVCDLKGECWPLSTTSTAISTSTSTTSTKTSTSSTPSTASSTTTTISSTPLSTKTTSTTTSSTTTQPPCSCPGGYENGEFIPYPNSCDKYYICYNGELLEESCGYGNYFDKDSKSCVCDLKGECWPLSTTSTAISTSTSTTSTKTSTSSTPSTASSTTTTISSTPLSTKTTSATTSSTTTQPPCSCPGGYENGEFIPYPNSCDKYYICYNGELLEQSCGYGNYFDANSKSCAWDLKGECWPISTTSTALSTSTSTKLSTTSTPSTATSTSSTPPSTTKSTTTAPCGCPGGYADGEFVSNPDSCFLFFVCYEGELREVSCGFGNYFDDYTKTCVLDTGNQCWTKPTTESTSTTTDAVTSAPCVCPGGYESGEFVSNPDSCHLFFVCYQGKLVEVSCGIGNYFDAITKSCVPDPEGKCWPTSSSSTTASSTTSIATSPPCTCAGGYKDGDFVVHPNSCNLFYVCYQGELTEMSCGVGNYFDSVSTSCKFDTEGRCWPKSSSTTSTTVTPNCPNGHKEGELVQNPSSCFLFYICTSGHLVGGSCGTGNFFNDELKLCELDTTGSCWPKNPITPPGPEPCDCPNGLKEGQLMANPSSCYLYSICSGGKLVEGNCGTGNYFNGVAKVCEPDTTGSCWPKNPITPPGPEPCDCPNGLKEGQLMANPSSCYLYSICSGGKLVDGNCGTGNYFNGVAKVCEPDTTGSCWPKNPIPPPGPEPCDCPNGLKEGQLMANPSSCYLYSICSGGKLVEGNCGTGNYFNGVAKVCEPDTTGSCWPKNPITPPGPEPCDCPNGLKEGQLMANPSSCYLYSICSGGKLVEGNCGTGNYFNGVAKVCEPDTTGSCWPKNPITPPGPEPCDCPNGLKEGQLMANPSSCYLYSICSGGKLVDGNCGTGNYFNGVAKVCEPDTTGSCWPKNPIPPPGPEPCDCPNGLKEGQLMANPSSCYLYSICSGGKLVEGNCGTGNYFNGVAKVCEPDTTGSCWPKNPIPPPGPEPCDCPNGLKEGQLMANPSSCYLYSICSGGKLVEGNCGTGNYFNGAAKVCEPDTTGSCWPKNPITPPGREPCDCPNGLKEGQLMANPSSCYLYSICSGGKLVEGNCGTGNYFNDAAKVCEPDTTGSCWPKNPITPPGPEPCDCPNGLKEGQLMANPSSCYLYSICSGGKLVEGNCGTGNYFNDAAKVCEPDTTGSCWPKNPITPPGPEPCDCPNGLKEGQLMANPSSCYLYSICSGGKLVEGNCGTGNYFNDAAKVCEPDTTGSCWPKNPITPPGPEPCDCPNGLKEGQLMANPSSCYLYSICSGGKLVEGNCGTGNYFNGVAKVCEPDTTGSCWPKNPIPPPGPEPCDCPNGLKAGQLMANPSSCYLYSICSGGKLVEGNCGTGNYFNGVAKVCEPDTTGSCWPKNPIPPPGPEPCDCPNGLKEGQLMANPSSCYLYSICSGGKLVEGNCGTGNYFNGAAKVCEPDTTGSCWPQNPITPPGPEPCDCPNGLKEGQLMANPSSCYLYSICSGGKLVEGNCGTGNYFNDAAKVCEPDTTGSCWPKNPITPPGPEPCDCPNGLKEGQLMANPSSCYLYSICSGGKLVEGNCGTGNYFNGAAKVCEPDTTGSCWPKNPIPSPDPVPCECPNGLKEGQFAPHPSSCYLYNVCSGGQLIESNCGTGNYFNNVTHICEPDTNGICWPKKICPGNYSSGALVPNPQECDKFFICYDGILIEQECGVGNYFDPVKMFCTRDTMGSCWTIGPKNNTCEGKADGTFLASETDCDKFFMCYNNEKLPQECGVGNVFNAVTLSCVHDTLGTCWKKVPNVCANCTTGAFALNPSNCQEFYVCHQNRAVLQKCGTNNWFNPSLMICQPDLKAECINVCQGINGTTQLPHRNCNQFYICRNGTTHGVGTCPTGTNFDATVGICQSTAICEADLCAKQINGVIFPVQNDMTSFYTCYNSVPVKLQCPDGTSFDSDRLICTPDTGRCIGKKNGYTAASHNNPNAYYVCKNNLAIFEQCPSYAVYDEKKGVCVHAQRRRLEANICSTEPDGRMIAGDACNEFHLCLDGEDTDQNCGAYSSFNQKLGYCVFNLSCFDQNEICAKSSDIEKFPDARYKTSFIKCKQGSAVVEKCPPPLVYSHDIGYCVPKEMAMTDAELDGLCEDILDNTMAPALDCRKFYICRQGMAILQQCAIDQHFDVKKGACLPDVERRCWMRSETLRRSLFIKTVCQEGQIRSVPRDYGQFETCTFGVWMREACPAGHFFDPKGKVCIEKVRARSIQFPECLDGMPMRASETSCTDYYRCQNNQWIAGRCPVGEFFNSKMASCTSDVSACARNPEIRISSTKDNLCQSNETQASDRYCGMFYVCHEGEWWYRFCEKGSYFNKTLGECVANDGTCRLISDTGPCRSGAVKKSEFDPCVAYHLCVDGNWTLHHCPGGHYFNETHKACMLDDKLQSCQDDVNRVSSSCVEGDRRFNPTNCAAFFLCSLENWLSVQCRAGYYFDMALKVCITNHGECSADGLLRRQCAENTSHPSRKNCNQFYYCSKGKWQVESCLRGYQYNATIEKCVQTNSPCSLIDASNWIEDQCIGSANESYFAHDSDCTKFDLCVEDVLVEGQCRVGKFFDHASKRCLLNDGTCPLNIATDDICKDESNGTHLQNPANCTTFFTCIDNAALLSYCPSDNYFNSNTRRCEIDNGTCTRPHLCDGKPGGHLPHEIYCNIFYACVRGTAIPVACEENEFFDPLTNKCISDVDHRCVDGLFNDEEACANAANGRLLIDYNDCTKYILCANGSAERLQCPHGQFFDGAVLSCMPNNGYCTHMNQTDLPSANITRPDPNSCVGKHGDLMPDPEHCNEFYMCVYGNLRHDRCYDGEFFDFGANSCTTSGFEENCPTAGEMSILCDTSEDETNFADQSDCRKFYQCNNGELQSKKCRTGESFDTLLGFCRQNDGTCLLENGKRVGACAGKHGKLTADAENCRGYFACFNGQKITEECETTEYFDKVTGSCRTDVNNTCTLAVVEFTNATQLSCTNFTEHVFYPNFIDACKTFFQCIDGTPRVHKCPDDLLYNYESGKCDWKDYVKCIDMNKPHQRDMACFDGNNGTRYANTAENCDSYFICADGKPINFNCDQGLKFNVKLEKCDLASNVNCTSIGKN